MRRAASASVVLAATAGMLVVPVLALPVAQAHAVSPHVASVAVQPRPATRGVLGLATLPRTHRFDLVGATWRRGTLDAGAASIEVRIRHDGRWSGWRTLSSEDGGADGGTPDAQRAAVVNASTRTAEPIWVGEAEGLQARVVGAGHVPAGLHVLLVDGGTSTADANPRPVRVWGGSVASAAQDQPTIYTRADWGADESLRRSACPNGPEYSPTIKMGFIHHTDTGNGYSRADVPGIIRSIYAYHVRANGWCDVGYNYLVDRFGRIWEGRAGGITEPVLGAHTGGFNYDSFGASLIGSYTGARPSAAMLSATEQLFAWRLGSYYLDPTSTTSLVAGSFSGSRYSTGTTVPFKTISGHRDADETTCPGAYAYADLPDIRVATRQAMGAGFVAPAASTDTARMADGEVTLTAGAITSESWTLTVTDSAGSAVRTVTGTASRTTDVAALWDLTDDAGAPVPPGTYTLTLTAANADGASALPWSTTMSVTPPVTLTVPSQTGLDAPLVATGAGIPGHTVTVTVAGPSGPQAVGSFLVSRAGKWSAAASPVTADRDLVWTVTDPAISSFVRTRSTRIAPAMTALTADPAFVPAGSALTVSGTALPEQGAAVQLVTEPAAGGSPTTGSPVPVNADGSWTLAFAPTAVTSYWVVDSRGLSSATRTVYPVGAATASAPAAGYAGRTVIVHGNAGGAPVPVTLAARQPGGSWTTVKSVTASPTGRYTTRLPLADSPGEQTRWRVTTDYGPAVTGAVSIEPVFPPTVTGPSRAGWRSNQLLSGTAVPGDVVTVWTAPAGTVAGATGWVQLGTATAAADDGWSVPVRFRRDTSWRVTSASGESEVGTTVVAPTIHAPSYVVARALAVISGVAIPGQGLTLYRRLPDAATWTVDTTLTVASDGSWSVRRHPRRSMSYRAVSHGQTSRTIAITVE